VTLQAQQIDNNVVRVAVQALAAVLGGTQSLHTNAKDEALALPTAETAELALRTQQVLAYESGVAEVVDPLAGSYYVESLTDAVERGAWEYIERIDERGGALAAVETGYIQSEIQDAAYEYQRQVERGQRIIVGTNRFQSSQGESTIDILMVDPSVRQRQCERLCALRARRDNQRCQNVLERLQTAATNDHENVLPLIVDAVEAYCTLGEISDAFRAVWGEARDFGRV
jgi:methylmalonyl-CoA mutase N-terminal domain/subunit